MNIIYIFSILLLLVISFSKKLQAKLLSISIISTLIIILSSRTNLDEYQRYLDLLKTNYPKLTDYSLFNEPLYALLGNFVNSYTTSPLFFLYLISYTIIFICLYKSSYIISKDWKATNFSILFYLCHFFISYAFSGIRGGVANSLCALSAVLFFKNRNLISIPISIAAALVHLQTIAFSILMFSIPLIKRIGIYTLTILRKVKKLILTLGLAVIISVIIYLSSYFRESISILLMNIFKSSGIDMKYIYYISDEIYGRTLDLSSTQFLASISLTFVFIILLFSKKEKMPLYIENLTYLYSTVPIIMILFSDTALYAFRLASTFNTLLIPLISYLWINTYPYKNRLIHSSNYTYSKTKILMILIAFAMLYYNIFYMKRFNGFSL
ncbi:EpsG family protein [Prochlorococcus sp. MIT 1011]|uniref:EpsG family protein n=1 Tax=Prochlorococcus sp. MIT 1011 TaxID=3082520 RepID=UPI0039B5DD12